MKKIDLKGKRVFFVIPAYNEEKSIPLVISGLKRAGHTNIIVIDDGSKDSTAKAARSADPRVHVLQHIVNRGQGAALRTGIDFALLNEADYIITFDSDGQHRVEDIPAMLSPLLREEVEVTLGSRFLKKTKMPLGRRLLLKGSVLVQWIFYGVRLTDAHNGFRAMTRDAALKIRIRSNRMEHASEIVEEIAKKKISYREVPVIINYTNYSMEKGAGSFIGALKILFKMSLKKLVR